MASLVASLEVEIDADVKGLSAGMDKAEREINGFEKNTKTPLNNVVGMIGGIAAGIGAFSIGQEVINTAIEFESAWAGVEKTVDATDAELLALKDTIRDMATDTENPVSALEDAFVTLSGIAELGGQLGIAKEDIDDFTQTVGMLTMATNLGAEEAATFFARFANVTGLPTDKYDELGDVIVTLGNNFAVTESELANWGLRLASLSSFDWSAEDIMGYGAAMASAGLTAELGSTNLIKTVTDMTNAVSTGSPKLQDFADAAGMTADEFSELAKIDNEGAFNAFLKGLSEMDIDDQLKTLNELGFTSSEQQRTLLTMASTYEDTLTPAVESSSGAMKGNNALIDEAGKRAETTEGKINTLGNNFEELKATVGEMFLPVVNSAVVTATDHLNHLKNTLNVATTAFETGFALVGIVMDDVKRAAEMAWAGIQMTVLSTLADIGAKLYEFSVTNDPNNLIPDMDVNQDVRNALFDTQAFMVRRETADDIVRQLQEQLASGGKIDLSDTITFDAGGGNIAERSIAEMLTNFGSEETIANISERGKYVIQTALQQAIDNADLSSSEILLDTAMKLDLDPTVIEDFKSQFNTAVWEGQSGPEVAPAVDVKPTLADGENTKSLIVQAVEALDYTPSIAADADVNPTVTNLETVVSDVTSSVEAQSYQASVEVAVTLIPILDADAFNAAVAAAAGSGGTTVGTGSTGAGGSQSAPPVGSGQGPGLMGGSVTTINVSTGNVVSERDLLEIVEDAARKAGIK